MRLHGGEVIPPAWHKLPCSYDDQSAVFPVRDGLPMGLEILHAPVRIVTVRRRNGHLQALLGLVRTVEITADHQSDGGQQDTTQDEPQTPAARPGWLFAAGFGSVHG